MRAREKRLVAALCGAGLLCVGVLSRSWWTAHDGATTMDVGLRSQVVCELGECVVSQFRGGEGAFRMLALATWIAGLVAAGLALLLAALRFRIDTEALDMPVMGVCLLVIPMGAVTLFSIPGAWEVSLSWGCAATAGGASLCAFASRAHLDSMMTGTYVKVEVPEEVRVSSPVHAAQPLEVGEAEADHLDDISGEYSAVLEPLAAGMNASLRGFGASVGPVAGAALYGRAEALQSEYRAFIGPVPVETGGPAPGTPLAGGTLELALRMDTAQRARVKIAEVDEASRALRFVARDVRVHDGGLDVIREDGLEKKLSWRQIARIAVRRLPPEAPYHRAAVLDLVPVGQPPIRILGTTRVNYQDLPSGAAPNSLENLRRLGLHVQARSPDGRYDMESVGFFLEKKMPTTFSGVRQFLAYDEQYG